MNKRKKILICPLDWGLGHATRCIPIINSLLKKNIEIIIAADGQSQSLLKQEFPKLEHITFEGYNVTYPKKGNMISHFIGQVPKLASQVKAENKQLQELIQKHNIDGVISDNRYGLYSSSVPCIFITHQVMVKAPLFEKPIHRLIKGFCEKYTNVWVPDFEGTPNLSGDLAHKYILPNGEFIGPLSRFENLSFSKHVNYKYDLMVIISGPEDQRTVFENCILDQLQQYHIKAIVLRGLPGRSEVKHFNTFSVFPHLETKIFLNEMAQAKLVICRSGYSTIMDLYTLGKNAVFIPTPGQTEQEYLAKYYEREEMFYAVDQDKLDLKEIEEKSKYYSGWKSINHSNQQLLEGAIEKFIAKI